MQIMRIAFGQCRRVPAGRRGVTLYFEPRQTDCHGRRWYRPRYCGRVRGPFGWVRTYHAPFLVLSVYRYWSPLDVLDGAVSS